MRSYNDIQGIITYYMGSLSGLYPRGLQGLALFETSLHYRNNFLRIGKQNGKIQPRAGKGKFFFRLRFTLYGKVRGEI